MFKGNTIHLNVLKKASRPFSLKWPSFLWCSSTAFMSPGWNEDRKQSARSVGASPSSAVS